MTASLRKKPRNRRAVALANREFTCKIVGCKSTGADGRPKCWGSKSDLNRHYNDCHETNIDGTPVNRFLCPVAGCRRNTGNGFPRAPNRDDHVRTQHENFVPQPEPVTGEPLLYPAVSPDYPMSFVQLQTGYAVAPSGPLHSTSLDPAMLQNDTFSQLNSYFQLNRGPHSTGFDHLHELAGLPQPPQSVENVEPVVESVIEELTATQAERVELLKKLERNGAKLQDLEHYLSNEKYGT